MERGTGNQDHLVDNDSAQHCLGFTSAGHALRSCATARQINQRARFGTLYLFLGGRCCQRSAIPHSVPPLQLLEQKALHLRSRSFHNDTSHTSTVRVGDSSKWTGGLT